MDLFNSAGYWRERIISKGVVSVESVAPEAVLEENTQSRSSVLAVAVSLQLHQPFPSTENQRTWNGMKFYLHPN